jgi:segregation and condensation protein A
VESQTAQFGLAAEYLVMAAWLAYLKSRLLLPKPATGGDEAPVEELAEALAFRLAKLDAMRKAADALKDRPQLGRDVFPRGDPDALSVQASRRMVGGLYELMEAYAGARARPEARRYIPPARVDAYPLEAARERLKALLPRLRDWTTLDRVAPDPRGEGPGRRSCVASTFSAGLEMTKDGALELKQAETFAALYLRARRGVGP